MTHKVDGRKVIILVNSDGEELERLLHKSIIYENRRYLLLVEPGNTSSAIDHAVIWQLCVDPDRLGEHLLIDDAIIQLRDFDIDQEIRKKAKGLFIDDSNRM